MNDVNLAANALEEALKALLGIFGEESTTPEAIDRLHERCRALTTGLVTATTASSSAELQEAAPALRRAQRLNAIARALVEHQRDTAGTLIATAHQARRALGADAPVPDGTSCDVRA